MKRSKTLDFDEIFEIREMGEYETYDFVIPQTHCFVANGILVHNSGDLEANADGVLGIYRKDREAEFTEIECLKGRDTGTWRTVLRFDRFTQRFYDVTDESFDDQPIVDTWMDRER